MLVIVVVMVVAGICASWVIAIMSMVMVMVVAGICATRIIAIMCVVVAVGTGVVVVMVMVVAGICATRIIAIVCVVVAVGTGMVMVVVMIVALGTGVVMVMVVIVLVLMVMVMVMVMAMLVLMVMLISYDFRECSSEELVRGDFAVLYRHDLCVVVQSLDECLDQIDLISTMGKAWQSYDKRHQEIRANMPSRAQGFVVPCQLLTKHAKQRVHTWQTCRTPV